MQQMRSIEIDFDVHKRIEIARQAFEESPNDVLRRLLEIGGLPDAPPNVAPPQGLVGKAWFGKGVELPHGTQLRMDYNGKVHTGLIDNGIWKVEGTESGSPSDAAGSVARTKDGGKPSLNGWNYWQVKRPTDRTWRPLGGLRK
jgi:SeqA protein N-terminal domain